jgi:hypothetical protein
LSPPRARRWRCDDHGGSDVDRNGRAPQIHSSGKWRR